MPFKIGPLELVLVLVIVLIIFGAGRLPEIGNAMGKAIRQFRKSQTGEDEDKPGKTESKGDKRDTGGLSH